MCYFRVLHWKLQVTASRVTQSVQDSHGQLVSLVDLVELKHFLSFHCLQSRAVISIGAENHAVVCSFCRREKPVAGCYSSSPIRSTYDVPDDNDPAQFP
jgi:hypothetical protein